MKPSTQIKRMIADLTILNANSHTSVHLPHLINDAISILVSAYFIQEDCEDNE